MSTVLPKAKEVFTPGSPIAAKEFFSGRFNEINRVIDAIGSPGVNPIIHGQRGVGKTSLANILGELLPNVMTVRIGCDTTDTFGSIWEKVFRRAPVEFKKRAMGFSDKEVVERRSLADFIADPQSLTPGDVISLLMLMKIHVIFILDEFDRVTDPVTQRAMADLIKTLSDERRPVTIVIVGVGGTVSDLIGEHPSIARNLRQIALPRMSDEEMGQILAEGFGKLGITADAEVQSQIITMGEGFPHYAHLLGLACARLAEDNYTKHVDQAIFEDAAALAAEDAIETLREAFAKATMTAKPSNYSKILIGCALADADDRGVFRATDVMNASNNRFGLGLTVPAVTPALGEFCSPDRGRVLTKVPVANRSHYRFSDPLMRPFLKLKSRTVT